MTRLAGVAPWLTVRRCGGGTVGSTKVRGACVFKMSALPPPVLGTFREWRHPKARRGAGLRLTHSLGKGEVESSILSGSTTINLLKKLLSDGSPLIFVADRPTRARGR